MKYLILFMAVISYSYTFNEFQLKALNKLNYHLLTVKIEKRSIVRCCYEDLISTKHSNITDTDLSSIISKCKGLEQ